MPQDVVAMLVWFRYLAMRALGEGKIIQISYFFNFFITVVANFTLLSQFFLLKWIFDSLESEEVKPK